MGNLFLRFLRHPLRTGACCASSPVLAEAITGNVDIPGAGTVVELGPGTGAITGAIVDKLSPGCRFIAIELDQHLAGTLQQHFPEAKVHCDSAVNLPDVLEKEGAASADVIVSGLPWALFSESLQRQMLSAVCTALPPGGTFTTFAYVQGAYLPAGIRLRKQLNEMFSKVEKSRVVWKNFPPAFIYRCTK